MAAGFEPDHFWHQTPRLLAIAFAGKAEQLRRERDEQMNHAWHVAVLSRLSKIPALKSLLTPAAPSAPQTPEQQWAVFADLVSDRSRMH